ncbi:hypothetical protein CHUAL_011959 [Chamberlinius hualienensis]
MSTETYCAEIFWHKKKNENIHSDVEFAVCWLKRTCKEMIDHRFADNSKYNRTNKPELKENKSRDFSCQLNLLHYLSVNAINFVKIINHVIKEILSTAFPKHNDAINFDKSSCNVSINETVISMPRNIPKTHFLPLPW